MKNSNKRICVQVLAVFSLGAMILSSGCATVAYGDKTTEAELKKFTPVQGKVSLYVCREQAYLSAAGVRTVVFVDNEAIGTVKPNMFVYTALEPGRHGILLRNDGLASGSGGFETFEGKANDVVFYWVGVTGKGFGVLTVDHFDSTQDAMKCVSGAVYSVKAN
jgi:hypothetical protein